MQQKLFVTALIFCVLSSPVQAVYISSVTEIQTDVEVDTTLNYLEAIFRPCTNCDIEALPIHIEPNNHDSIVNW